MRQDSGYCQIPAQSSETSPIERDLMKYPWFKQLLPDSDTLTHSQAVNPQRCN